MDLLHLLSWTCIVLTLGMFSTGLVDLKKMQKTKSTDNIQFLPFLITCASNLGWLYYGMLKNDSTIMVVNLTGALLQTLYILVYLKYTKQKRDVVFQMVAVSAVGTSAGLYFVLFLPPGSIQLNQLGLFCSVTTVGVYLSPLADLVAIVRSGDVQRLSFPLTVATFFTCTSWVLYGYQLNDYYILVPNLPGIITSIIRFYLFRKYASSGPSYKSMYV
ncbi:sugar transporter SWEET1 [Corythoichthys intestinalis]|uniref:sugar transporter SWEET1 n=1 Tax=Corythoichthys intestinalis TaxID=161448 RepID=UPI0025A62CAC|nr:sugar transporter SWEET1 [Corythoichthys intestinalis]XP_061790005.1 sugar transporter SWEET1-like [Nerophis lumbriciformis]